MTDPQVRRKIRAVWIALAGGHKRHAIRLRQHPRWRSLSVRGGMTSNDPGLALRIYQREKVIMPTGVVKWFDPAKGFGFIVPDDGGNDVFVHVSAVERAGLHSLNEGQKVEYEPVPSRDGKLAAENLAVVD